MYYFIAPEGVSRSELGNQDALSRQWKGAQLGSTRLVSLHWLAQAIDALSVPKSMAGKESSWTTKNLLNDFSCLQGEAGHLRISESPPILLVKVV